MCFRKKLLLPPSLEPHHIIQTKLQDVVIPPGATGRYQPIFLWETSNYAGAQIKLWSVNAVQMDQTTWAIWEVIKKYSLIVLQASHLSSSSSSSRHERSLMAQWAGFRGRKCYVLDPEVMGPGPA